METNTLTKSWLTRELDRPLCALRRGLQGIVDEVDLKIKDQNLISALKGGIPKDESKQEIQDIIDERGNSLWEELDSKYPGAFPFEKGEWKRAIDWVMSGNKVSQGAMDQPAVQAVWGTALMINKSLGYPRDEKEILLNNKRLIDEKNLMASLLLGTIKSKKATIAWGKSGSWFYHDPVGNHINMDPGQALLLGLQNARSILLHEVGHSQITGDRTKRMQQIKERIEELCPKARKGMRKLPEDPKERKEVQKLSREYALRENFWQYAEDACVNTYGEIEGSNFTNDIVNANKRVYTIILLGREQRAVLEKQLSKSPLKGLEKVLGISLKPAPKEEPNAEEAELLKKIESRLKAAAAAYPISRGWINLEDQEEWKLLGAEKEEKTIELIERLSKPKNSFAIGEDMPIGAIQPGIIAKRFELVSDSSVNRITKECIEERNRLIDETFDEFLLPLIEKLPDPPEPTGPGPGPGPGPNPGPKPPTGEGEIEWEESEGGEGGPGGKEGEGKEGEGDPTKGDPTKVGKEPIKPIGKPDNSVENETKTIEDSIKDAEKEKELEDEERRRQGEDTARRTAEAVRNSMGKRSPLAELPTGCGNYQEAAEALRPQIAMVTSILKKIALKQKTRKLGEKEVLPDPIKGIASFDRDSFLERKKKEAGGEEITMEDRKHFKHDDNSAKKSTTTHLAFYIDGSGSMSGSQAEKTMMTLIIFNEASKRVPEIQISAVYSGADKTVTLLSEGKVCPGREKLIADILKGGYAWGDNEISPQGLAEMNAEIEKTIPCSGAFGMTHTVFLTDGWSCPTDRGSIGKAIKTTLDGNPLSTFDTFILNGGEGGAFQKTSEGIKTKRANQMPMVKTCSDINDTCPAIVQTLLARIRTFKSFNPQHVMGIKQKIKKTKKKLLEQEAEVLAERDF